MAIQTTSNLSPFHVQYHETYIREAMFNRLYDQFAVPFPGDMAALMSGSSVSYPFLSDMNPGTTAISQTADVTPQILLDATASITPTSRGEALQWSELLGDIQQSYNLNEERAMKLGKNQAESVDLLAQAQALQGTFIYRAAARASLDAGTSGHRASDSLFGRMQGYLQTLKVPGFITADGGQGEVWMALMHPYPFHDIRESGNVDAIGLYQNAGIHLNFELGKIGPFRLVANAWAKVFWSAGVANASAIATTVATQAASENDQLDDAIEVAANTNIDAGDWITVGTLETGNTHYPKNERLYVTAVSGTTISVLGEGPNGGLRFAHAVGETVSNADPVYPIVFGGPSSLVKLYAPNIGEFGQLVPEERTGLLKQFIQSGWKWYGGYARLVDNRVLRVEVSSSYDA